MISETALRQNAIYVNLYVVWSKIIFIEIIPYFAIFIMNIFIITKITKSTRFRRKFQRQYPDQETNVGCPNTQETTVVHTTTNGRRVGKVGSQNNSPNDTYKLTPQRSISVDQDDRRKLENNLAPPSDNRIPFTKRMEKEKEESGERQPFLTSAKHPSIEVESATEDDPNSGENHDYLAMKVKDTEIETDAMEVNNVESCKHSPNSDSDHKPCNKTKNDITPTSKPLEISEGGISAPTRLPISVGCKRSLSQPNANSYVNKSGKKTKVQKKHFLRKQQEEHSLGIILIIMSILFIICQSLKIVPDMYEIIVCESVEGSKNSSKACNFPAAISKISELSHLLVCVNSAANFLIYYCAGGKFREAWLETYGFWWCCCSMRNLKKMVMVPFNRRNTQSTRGSHDVSGGDVISQTVRLSPNRSVQNIQLTPMGKRPTPFEPSQNKDCLVSGNCEAGNHVQSSNESSVITKTSTENEERSNKLTYSEV